MAQNADDIINENAELNTVIERDNLLKNLFVDYVGNKIQPEDNNVTVGMIIDVLKEEFPEFILAFAEENFVRGYQQAMADIEYGMQTAMEESFPGAKEDLERFAQAKAGENDGS